MGADFAEWSAAGLPSLGFDADEFAAAYERNRASTRELPLEASPIVDSLMKLLHGGSWEGSASELLAALERSQKDSDVYQGRDWPDSPEKLSSELLRIAPILREAHGVEIKRGGRTPGGTKRVIRIWRVSSEKKKRRRRVVRRSR